MRFLAIVPEAFGGFGGIAVYNRDFLTALSELPVCEEITILPRLIRQEPGTLPARVKLIKQASNRLARYFSEFARILCKREKYDVVLCGHINLLPFATIASKLLGAKHVLLIYGIDAWTPTSRRVSNWLVAYTDAVISISGFTSNGSCPGVLCRTIRCTCCLTRYIWRSMGLEKSHCISSSVMDLGARKS